jgi:DNA polymerase-3 subunit gamma/tau
LDKEFIKIISLKLYEWTGNRWIITLSKKKGNISIKEKEESLKKDNLDKIKKGKIYNIFLNTFPDAELIDIENQGLDND